MWTRNSLIWWLRACHLLLLSLEAQHFCLTVLVLVLRLFQFYDNLICVDFTTTDKNSLEKPREASAAAAEAASAVWQYVQAISSSPAEETSMLDDNSQAKCIVSDGSDTEGDVCLHPRAVEKLVRNVLSKVIYHTLKMLLIYKYIYRLRGLLTWESLWAIPTPMRDGVYDYVAKRRYEWFGKAEDCLVLQEKELLKHFINREEMMNRDQDL